MGRRPLILNMDETSVVRRVSGLRGTIVRQRSRVRKKGQPLPHGSMAVPGRLLSPQGNTRWQRRQSRRAQDLSRELVLIAEQHLRELGLNAHVMCDTRQKGDIASAFSQGRTVLGVLTSSGDLVHERYVIVLLDVHPSHFDSTIFQHARRCGLRLIYVPAKMTAFLQPCDTHVFAKFKFAYRKAWQEEKSRAPGGHVSTVCWLQLVCGVVQKIVSQGNWQKAFLAAGILESQQQMSSQLLSDLGFQAAVAAPSGAPSEQAAACIFPRRSKKLDIISCILWQPKSHRSKAALGQDSQPAEASSSSSAVPSQKRRILPATFQAKVIRRLE